MTNNTNKWDKLLGILLCLGVFLGLIYLSYSNRHKAEEFGKVIEKHYNVSIPSNLITKEQKLTWFCSQYKLGFEECKSISNIETKIAAGNLMTPEGFDIKKYDDQMALTRKEYEKDSFYDLKTIDKEIEKKRLLNIETSSLSIKELYDLHYLKRHDCLVAFFSNPFKQ